MAPIGIAVPQHRDREHAVPKPAVPTAAGAVLGTSAMTSRMDGTPLGWRGPVTLPAGGTIGIRPGGLEVRPVTVGGPRGESSCRRTGRRPPFGALAQRDRARHIVSKTGWTSVGELLITLRISLVAVCCSSASVSSRLRASSSLNRRTFSMAITAWSAKVWSSAICVSVKGRLRGAWTVMAPIGLPSCNIGTDRACRTVARTAVD